MAIALRSALSYLLPTVAGWTIVSALWPNCPRMLRGVLGLGLGLGIAGMVWMLSVIVFGTARVSLLVCDGTLIALTVVSWIRRPSRNAALAPIKEPSSRLQRGGAAALMVIMLFVAITIGHAIRIGPHGGFDAIAIWNSRARFFYLATKPLNVLPDVANPEYPILLPALIVRGWQYNKQDTVVIPISLAAIFTVGTILLLLGLRSVTGSRAAWLGGAVLAGTPFFLMHGLSQYADVVMSFFITAGVVTFAIADFSKGLQSTYLPFIAGLFAGFAACVKNEGTLVVVAMVLSRLCILAWDRQWKTEGIRIGMFLAGLLPGVLTLAAHRKVSPPSYLLANMTSATIQSRITSLPQHSAILAGYWRDLRHFGEWWINPLLLLLVFVVIRRSMKSALPFTRAWRLPALFVAMMLCGFYLIYLFTPYEVNWHVASSFNRLLLQLWPSALLLWIFLITPERTEQSRLADSRNKRGLAAGEAAADL